MTFGDYSEVMQNPILTQTALHICTYMWRRLNSLTHSLTRSIFIGQCNGHGDQCKSTEHLRGVAGGGREAGLRGVAGGGGEVGLRGVAGGEGEKRG